MSYVFSLNAIADRESSDDEAPRFGTWSARAKLLYGQWTTADGTEVLFDRKYRPKWRRHPDGTVEPADPSEWIDDIVQENWFYTDRASLSERKQINARIAAEWRLAVLA
jgi:hypothetical protein